MKSRNNLLLGLFAGAGFALGYWLNSDKGRERIKELSSRADEWSDKGLETAETMLNKAAQSTTEMLDKSIELAEKAKEKTSEPISLGKHSAKMPNGAVATK